MVFKADHPFTERRNKQKNFKKRLLEKECRDFPVKKKKSSADKENLGV